MRSIVVLLLACLSGAEACTPTLPPEDGGGAPGSGGAGSGGTVASGAPGSGGVTSANGGSGDSGGSGGVGSGGVSGGSGGAGKDASEAGGASGTGGGGAPDALHVAAPQPGAGGCTRGGSGFDTAITGVAVDRKSCLAWERGDPDRDVSKCPLNIRDNKSKLCWDEAIAYCTALRLDGKSDWRLPTLAELQTIVVPDNYPTIDMTVFPQAVVSIYWSSEKKGEKIVAIDFSNHGMVNDHIGPDGPQATRCVRLAGK